MNDEIEDQTEPSAARWCGATSELQLLADEMRGAAVRTADTITVRLLNSYADSIEKIISEALTRPGWRFSEGTQDK